MKKCKKCGRSLDDSSDGDLCGLCLKEGGRHLKGRSWWGVMWDSEFGWVDVKRGETVKHNRNERTPIMERTCEKCGKTLTDAEKKGSDEAGHDWCAICAMKKYNKLKDRNKRSIFGRILDVIASWVEGWFPEEMTEV